VDKLISYLNTNGGASPFYQLPRIDPFFYAEIQKVGEQTNVKTLSEHYDSLSSKCETESGGVIDVTGNCFSKKLLEKERLIMHEAELKNDKAYQNKLCQQTGGLASDDSPGAPYCKWMVDSIRGLITKKDLSSCWCPSNEFLCFSKEEGCLPREKLKNMLPEKFRHLFNS